MWTFALIVAVIVLATACVRLRNERNEFRDDYNTRGEGIKAWRDAYDNLRENLAAEKKAHIETARKYDQLCERIENLLSHAGDE